MELAIEEIEQMELIVEELTEELAEPEDEHQHAMDVFLHGAGRGHGDAQGHVRGVGYGRGCVGGRGVGGARGHPRGGGRGGGRN